MIRATRFRSAANVTSQVGTAIAAKVLLLGLALFWTGFAQAQSANLQFQAQQNPGASNGGAPLTITLQGALKRDEANDPQYRSETWACVADEQSDKDYGRGPSAQLAKWCNL